MLITISRLDHNDESIVLDASQEVWRPQITVRVFTQIDQVTLDCEGMMRIMLLLILIGSSGIVLQCVNNFVSVGCRFTSRVKDGNIDNVLCGSITSATTVLGHIVLMIGW